MRVDVAETQARIFNTGYGQIKFTCDAMTAIPIVHRSDTTGIFLISDGNLA